MARHSVQLTDAELAEVLRLALQEQRSLAQMLRLLILQALAARKSAPKKGGK